MTTTFGNGVWHLIMQSDFLTKAILLLLFMMNVVCTTLFLYKLVLTKVKLRQIKKAHKDIQYINTTENLKSFDHQVSSTLPGFLLHKTLASLPFGLDSFAAHTALRPQQLEHVEHSLEYSVEEIIHNEQSYLSIIFSCAAVSPLIGLFGTVWGLIHAFVGISEQQSADIATVAPGIAEALITTLAGLCVAIPTLMMYHYLMNKNRSLEYYVMQYAYSINKTIVRLFYKESL